MEQIPDSPRALTLSMEVLSMEVLPIEVLPIDYGQPARGGQAKPRRPPRSLCRHPDGGDPGGRNPDVCEL